MACVRIPGGILIAGQAYQPGDQPPEGYLAWHEWAEVQYKSGRRQVECGRCGRWSFPQELSSVIDEHKARDKHGDLVDARSPVCNKCVGSVQ